MSRDERDADLEGVTIGPLKTNHASEASAYLPPMIRALLRPRSSQTCATASVCVTDRKRATMVGHHGHAEPPTVVELAGRCHKAVGVPRDDAAP
jgi:hypothetical protein